MRLQYFLIALLVLIPVVSSQISYPNVNYSLNISNYSQQPISKSTFPLSGLYPLNPNQLQPRNYSEIPKYEPHITENNTQETKISQTDANYCIQICIPKNIAKPIAIIIGVIFALGFIIFIVWIFRKIFWI